MSQTVGSSIGGLAGVPVKFLPTPPPVLPPPVLPPPVLGLAAAATVSAGLLVAATAAYLDMRSAQDRARITQENLEKNLARLNFGTIPILQPANFTGGQVVGASYFVRVTGTANWANGTSTQSVVTTDSLIGAITAINFGSLSQSDGSNSRTYRVPVLVAFGGNPTPIQIQALQWSNPYGNWFGELQSWSIAKIEVLNSSGTLDTTSGSPAGTLLGTVTNPTPERIGNNSSGENAKPVAPLIGVQNNTFNFGGNTVNNSTTNNTFNSTTNNNSSLNTGTTANFFGIGSALGFGTAPATAPNPTTTPMPNPSPNKPPSTEPKKEEERKAPLQTTPSELGNINSQLDQIKSVLNNQIAGLGAIVGTIAANTAPEAQRLNSKNGACDALNSPSCTKGVEDRIKDPINGKVDDVAGKVAATASSVDLLKNVTDNSFKFISRIYNNQFIHSSLSFITTMTTIHNAAMLSRDVAETLGTVVDNSVNLSGQKLKDADGNDINFTSWIGTNIRALIVQLIGADKYVQLALQWQKANTIYHSAMSVINTTQSMLDPLSSAVEYGMENVSKIGNGLREDGVVSENSYPAMDETIRARRVNRFERLNDTLEGAENISSNLANVTGSAVSVKEDFRQLREDQKQLRDQAANFNQLDAQERAELKASLPTEITPLNLTPAPEEDTP